VKPLDGLLEASELELQQQQEDEELELMEEEQANGDPKDDLAS
jgi:hypothetical protein